MGEDDNTRSIPGTEKRGSDMPGTYKLVDLVGTSPAGFAEAAKAAVEEAAKTIRHIDWFEVVEQRGRVQNGKIAEFQVTLKIGFKIEREA
jgi:flavin-binding protein dodecin